MTRCAQCGFTYGGLPRHELSARLRECGDAYGRRLAADAVGLRTRPLPGQWSSLEYACHARDVALMQRDRLYVALMQRDRLYVALVEDEPSFKPMYRDQRVVFDRYDMQVPAVMADQVTMAADLLAPPLPVSGTHSGRGHSCTAIPIRPVVTWSGWRSTLCTNWSTTWRKSTAGWAANEWVRP
jgi:hypothetical protein